MVKRGNGTCNMVLLTSCRSITLLPGVGRTQLSAPGILSNDSQHPRTGSLPQLQYYLAGHAALAGREVFGESLKLSILGRTRIHIKDVVIRKIIDKLIPTPCRRLRRARRLIGVGCGADQCPSAARNDGQHGGCGVGSERGPIPGVAGMLPDGSGAQDQIGKVPRRLNPMPRRVGGCQRGVQRISALCSPSPGTYCSRRGDGGAGSDDHVGRCTGLRLRPQ